MPASSDIARNAAVRAILAATWPHVKFAVRSGRAHTAAVAWTDGPTETAVDEVVRGGRPDLVLHGRTRWGCTTHRVVSVRLAVVHYLRERAARHRYYTTANPDLGTGNGYTIGWYQLDAATVTDTEWAMADLVLAIAGPLHIDPRFRESTTGWEAARSVHLYAEAAQALMAAPVLPVAVAG